MSAVDLLPCPFCGSADVKADSFAHAAGVSVKCFGCQFELLGFWSDSHNSIAERWNRRAHPAPAIEAEPVAWESISAAYRRFVSDKTYRGLGAEARRWYKPYRCSTCATTASEVGDSLPTLDLLPCPFCGSNLATTGLLGYQRKGHCKNCGATGAGANNEDGAITLWNLRATHPQDAESLRGEVAHWKANCELAQKLADADKTRAEKAEAERDAALARVAEAEAILAREEKSHEGTIAQRDHAEDMADKLAHALAGDAIGEHSSANDPWQNALDYAALTPQPDAGLEDLIERLEKGVVASGLHEDNETELFLVDDASDTMAEAAAALRSRPVGEVWQDIETAPKDGQTVMLHGLLHTPSIEAGCPETVLGHWTDHNGGGWVWHGSLAITFTHWRPLPVGPGDVRAALTEGEAGHG